MTPTFCINLKTNRVLPQPVGPATSAVKGWRRGKVMSLLQTSTVQTEKRRYQCDYQRDQRDKHSCLKLTKIHSVYTRLIEVIDCKGYYHSDPVES